LIRAGDQILRITYEAFSKFSNNLNRCRTFEEIAECFTVNLKYLFNYHFFRASYYHNHSFIHLNTTLSGTTLTVKNKPEYFDYEKLLLSEEVPLYWNNIQDLNLPDCYKPQCEEQAELWGWNFVNDDRKILVSVLSTKAERFTKKDINFLRLVSDNLETKLLELCLIKELDTKNAIISKINEDQKEVIKQRTKEIENKNKTLLEISVLNAHNVREPLSRILGLINLLDDESANESINEILSLLKISSTDLDNALQEVITRTTTDLLKLKA
jgi:hypothetical protein